MMKLTAWAAHQAGKLRLPPGYRLELDADMMQLYRLKWRAGRHVQLQGCDSSGGSGEDR
jgi:hypothetical protein